VHKRARFLLPNWILELVWDSESKKAGSFSGIRGERFSRRARVFTPETGPPNILLSSVQQLISSNASDEEEVFQSGSSVRWCGVV
jgi:hypothetical protein